VLSGAILSLRPVTADGRNWKQGRYPMAVTIVYSCECFVFSVRIIFLDWEIGMRESGGPEIAALGELL
jgi:hypothetical protein